MHSGHVDYNVPSVVDAETHLIVTHEVTNQGHDRDLLAKMATQAKAALQRENMHILGDKGGLRRLSSSFSLICAY